MSNLSTSEYLPDFLVCWFISSLVSAFFSFTLSSDIDVFTSSLSWSISTSLSWSISSSVLFEFEDNFNTPVVPEGKLLRLRRLVRCWSLVSGIFSIKILAGISGLESVRLLTGLLVGGSPGSSVSVPVSTNPTRD